MNFLDGIEIEVAAVVTEGENMSDELSVEGADESVAAEAAEAAGDEAAAPEADAFAGVELDDEPADVNADGFAAVAGELFGGPDANQAVHETASEGFTVEEDEAGEVEEDEAV